MNNQVTHTLEERLLPLVKRIEQLEQRPITQGIEAIAERCAEEDEILRQMEALATLAAQAGDTFSHNVRKKVQGLVMRMQFLPTVPRIEVVRLAQQVLTLNPLVLVTDDTVNEERQQPELTRIFLMEPTKRSCFDYPFPASSHKSEGPVVVEERGEADDTLMLAASLEQAWEELQRKLSGRFVVAFDVPLAHLQLAVTARRYGLPIPMLVGHSLLDLLLKYTRVKDIVDEGNDEEIRLASDQELCRILAEDDVRPFVDASIAPADQRAEQLLQALQAIAEGTFSLQEPRPVEFLSPFSF